MQELIELNIEIYFFFENKDHCHNMEPVDKDKPVLVAGDPEKIHMEKCDEGNGISYHINQIKYAVKFCIKYSSI